MKKLILFLIIIIGTFATVKSEYQLGDQVNDINFESIIFDQSGNAVYENHSLSEFIDNDIPIFIYFFEATYQ